MFWQEARWFGTSGGNKINYLIDPDTMYPNELQPVDASSHKQYKLERSVVILH